MDKRLSEIERKIKTDPENKSLYLIKYNFLRRTSKSNFQDDLNFDPYAERCPTTGNLYCKMCRGEQCLLCNFDWTTNAAHPGLSRIESGCDHATDERHFSQPW